MVRGSDHRLEECAYFPWRRGYLLHFPGAVTA